jgi:starch-binding outer membrane protein, SusD/RagB family
MSKQTMTLVFGAILSALIVTGCNLDIPDLNNPGIDSLEANPTAAGVNTAATGLLIGNRTAKATTGGLLSQWGILGRESYDIDPADDRPVTEDIANKLNPSSPFGGAFWSPPYANIRLANIILRVVDKVAAFTDPQKAAIRGFSHTIIALELITVILSHDDIGAVIDTDHELGEPLGPFVKKAEVYAKIVELLDQAQGELMMATAGATDPTKVAFTFTLSPGYTGFNTPLTFIQFNRAIRAKIAVYLQDYKTALTILTSTDASNKTFINDDAAKVTFTNNLGDDKGVFYVYSTATGDATNGLINPVLFAHPALKTDAKMQAKDPAHPDATPPLDARYVAKVAEGKTTTTSGADDSVKTSLSFQIYPSNASPVPVIRNEELVLLKAEALWFTGDHDKAIAELNIVRTKAGKLDPLTTDAANPDAITDDAKFIAALLYDRRYSLMFEGGHRWIDLRRFGQPIPLDSPNHKRNVRFPVPQPECDARPGEPQCLINSIDPIAN